MKRLSPLLMSVALVFLPVVALGESPVRIEDVKQFAGEWQGWAGSQRVSISVKEDGTYTGIAANGNPATGKITVIDGKATFKSNFSAGDVILMEEKGKQSIKMVTPRGGAELDRVK
jgi:hypothetical protein